MKRKQILQVHKFACQDREDWKKETQWKENRSYRYINLPARIEKDVGGYLLIYLPGIEPFRSCSCWLKIELNRCHVYPLLLPVPLNTTTHTRPDHTRQNQTTQNSYQTRPDMTWSSKTRICESELSECESVNLSCVSLFEWVEWVWVWVWVNKRIEKTKKS